jgi:glycine/D-amino acid oxidase-like deaminating enzyme
MAEGSGTRGPTNVGQPRKQPPGEYDPEPPVLVVVVGHIENQPASNVVIIMSDVVVIGAGVFGVWTAYHLANAGASVTLVDAYGPGNSRSSSGDESRILRCGYGSAEIYSRFARRSRELWCELDARDGSTLPLWHSCGVLWLSPAGDKYATDTLSTLRRGQYPVEVLERGVFESRYPHLLSDGDELRMIEPEGGVIMARRSVQALAAGLSRKGVALRSGRALKPSASGRVSSVRLTDGTELDGDRFVFACGPWLPVVFPDVLGSRIVPTRQVVVYFGTPAGDDRFGATHTPALIDFAAGLYAIPSLENRGLKVGIDTHGPRFDPDSGERVVDRESMTQARAWLARRLPALSDAPVVESRVCQYENTASGDFLIDRHPDHENLWVVGGGSGHGFKHGPAVGEYVAHLISTHAAPDARFALRGADPPGTRIIR